MGEFFDNLMSSNVDKVPLDRDPIHVLQERFLIFGISKFSLKWRDLLGYNRLLSDRCPQQHDFSLQTLSAKTRLSEITKLQPIADVWLMLSHACHWWSHVWSPNSAKKGSNNSLHYSQKYHHCERWAMDRFFLQEITAVSFDVGSFLLEGIVRAVQKQEASNQLAQHTTGNGGVTFKFWTRGRGLLPAFRAEVSRGFHVGFRDRCKLSCRKRLFGTIVVASKLKLFISIVGMYSVPTAKNKWKHQLHQNFQKKF